MMMMGGREEEEEEENEEEEDVGMRWQAWMRVTGEEKDGPMMWGPEGVEAEEEEEEGVEVEEPASDTVSGKRARSLEEPTRIWGR